MEGDRELELSIRSVIHNYQGIARFVIVGDHPSFDICKYRAVHVGQNFASEVLRDAIRKFKKIAFTDCIPDEFVWMNDDIYALRTFSKLDLENVYYTHKREFENWKVKPGYRWGVWKKNTMKVLGISQIMDTATHMPRLMSREKCRKLFKRLSVNQKFDFQLAYDYLFTNEFRAIKDAGIFKRAGVINDQSLIKKFLGNVMFFNHNSAGFTPEMESFIKSTLVSDVAAEAGSYYEKKFIEKPKSPAFTRAETPKIATSIYEKCCHKGEDTGESVICGTCPATRKVVPIIKCKQHGLATRWKARTPHPKHGRPIDCVTCYSEGMGFKKES
jgi:hypothetical protein